MKVEDNIFKPDVDYIVPDIGQVEEQNETGVGCEC